VAKLQPAVVVLKIPNVEAKPMPAVVIVAVAAVVANQIVV
jgi:hypothetical protein